MEDTSKDLIQVEIEEEAIGEIPRGYLLKGYLTLLCIVIMTLMICTIHYDEGLVVKGIMTLHNDTPTVKSLIPDDECQAILNARDIRISFDSYPVSVYGYLNATIDSIDYKLDNGCYCVNLIIKSNITNKGNSIELFPEMECMVEYSRKKYPLIKKIIDSI